ncbi:MAG: BTAD domain-containing putative transcriptional regulator [Anaerolineales bacterium]
MVADILILQTKLIPPKPQQPSLYRPRLADRILGSLRHRVTLVQAATGYGKSTALAQALVGGKVPLFWYSAAETDADPVVFLLHIVHALRLQLPEIADSTLAFLRQGPAGGPASWRHATDMLINEITDDLRTESALIIDDFHLVGDAPDIAHIVTRLADYLPPNVHLILSARQRPALLPLSRWKVKGHLLEIGADDLAFTTEEIDALFRTQYKVQLAPADVERLARETEGWVIALQMIWKALESRSVGSLSDVWAALPETLDPLFDYLGKEVLHRTSPERQHFLLVTSVLRSLTPEACDAMLEWRGSETVLRSLCDDGLFVHQTGPHEFRYQHLFQDFLQEQLAAHGLSRSHLHRQAACFYMGKGAVEEAVIHYLAAGDFVQAAEQIATLAEGMIRTGRLDTLRNWISALPHPVLEDYPLLMVWLGDTYRLASQFEEALEWYSRAESRFRAAGDNAGLSRALRAQGTVYLDTVRPLRAEALLEEALRLNDEKDRRERAALLEALAENRTNLGRLQEAQALRQQARDLLAADGPSAADLDVRVLLRTGRIAQAQAVLEERAAEERAAPPHRPARAHRETLLLLSLIYAFRGKPEAAFQCAKEGIEIGRALGSPFVEAVGYMRLGHAYQIGRPRPAEAEACYQKAIALSKSLQVSRATVEPLWGLTRLYGFFGDAGRAEACAQEGIDIALAAGDEWIAALVRLTLGAVYVHTGRIPQGIDELARAEMAFLRCSDAFARTACRLWLSLAYLDSGDPAAFALHTDALLRLVQENDAAAILTAPSFFAPGDPQRCIPLLMEARRRRIHPAYVSRLLDDLGVAEFDSHPGYSLTVHMLGPLRIWRGHEEVAPREWQREKARQLFALLLAHRGKFLQRDQILEYLWPHADLTSAEAGFKVALNALNRALEPRRPARSAGFFVLRRESAYGLNPAAALHVDADEFESLLARAEQGGTDSHEAIALLREALALYQGDYLADFLYEEWTLRERERLRQVYVQATTRLAGLLADAGECEEAAAWCRRALTLDNCWEEAYRILMRCYSAQGNRPMVIRTFEQCEATLRSELDAPPMPETVDLYRRLIAEETPR